MTTNSLSSSALIIGQALVIPGKTAATTTSTTADTTTIIDRASETYWVKSGDNPFTIARKYNMTVERLLSLNNLSKSSKIFPGQKLLVE